MKTLQRQGRSLEELFFHKHNRVLAEQLHKDDTRRQKRQQLADATGIKDDALLDQLVDLDIDPATMVAFGLIPLIEIAWADFTMEPEERDTLLRVAGEQGIARDSVPGKILDQWLQKRPPRELLDAWKVYIRSLCEHLDRDQKSQLRDRLLGRARAIAESAGGFLGFGSKTSDAEEKKIRDLAKAFE